MAKVAIERHVPFARPSFSENDIAEIAERIGSTLRSGWLTSGPATQEFEDGFRQVVGTSEAVAVNSGTAALHSIMMALGVGPGDEVLVPSDTFVATANAAVYVGARPVFVDSDPDTFNISVAGIQEKISEKTKAIIPVHLAGNPCDMKAISEIATEKDIFVVEDAAHAAGSLYRGEPCGSLGVAGAFSFYPTKVLTTCEGGMVTTNDAKIAEKVKNVRNHGRMGFGPLTIGTLGYNFRMPDILAVIGLSQLKHLESFVGHRNEIAELYRRRLANIDWVKIQKIANGDRSSYYAFVASLTEHAPMTRDQFVSRLKQSGVDTSIMYHPAHTQPLYSGGDRTLHVPVAEKLGEFGFALPIYNGMSLEDADYVCDVIDELA